MILIMNLLVKKNAERTFRPRVDVMTRCGNQTPSEHSAYSGGTRTATTMDMQLVALHCAYLALITIFAGI